MTGRQKEADNISIRLDLEGEDYKRFEHLRKHYGIRNATDMLRFLIAQEFRRLSGSPTASQA